MRFIAIALLLLVGCNPPPTNDSTTTTTSQPTTTSVTTTTTRPVSTTTTTAPTGAFNIGPSGSDDTQRFVQAVRDHTTVNVTGSLIVNQVAEIRGLNGRTVNFINGSSLQRQIRSTLRTFQVLLVIDSQNITINNLKIIGPNIEVCDFIDTSTGMPRHIDVGYNRYFEAQHGLEINSSQNITISNPNIYGMSGDGIYFTSRSSQTNNVQVTNPQIRCTGRGSIVNVGSDDVSVVGGKLDMSGLWILNIEPDLTAQVNRYSVTGTQIGYSNFNWLFSSGPYFSCLVANVVINVNLIVTPHLPYKVNACVTGPVSVTTSGP